MGGGIYDDDDDEEEEEEEEEKVNLKEDGDIKEESMRGSIMQNSNR